MRNSIENAALGLAAQSRPLGREASMAEGHGTQRTTAGATIPSAVDISVEAIEMDGALLPVRLFIDETQMATTTTRILQTPGLVDPVIVWRESDTEDTYHLVFGLHRLQAHRALGRKTIPAVVLTGSLEAIARVAVERVPRGPGAWSEWEKAQAHGRAKAIFGTTSRRAYAAFIDRGRNETNRHIQVFEAFPERRVLAAMRSRCHSPALLTGLTKQILCDLAEEEPTLEGRLDRLMGILAGLGRRCDSGGDEAKPDPAPPEGGVDRCARWVIAVLILALGAAASTRVLEFAGGLLFPY